MCSQCIRCLEVKVWREKVVDFDLKNLVVYIFYNVNMLGYFEVRHRGRQCDIRIPTSWWLGCVVAMIIAFEPD